MTAYELNLTVVIWCDNLHLLQLGKRIYNNIEHVTNSFLSGQVRVAVTNLKITP